MIIFMIIFFVSFVTDCTSVDEIQNYVYKYNYEITINDIVYACKSNMKTDLILHLMSYKIFFDENSVNKIINYCKQRDNVYQILVTIQAYGYKFQQSNYLKMLDCMSFVSLFDKELIKDLIID